MRTGQGGRAGQDAGSSKPFEITIEAGYGYDLIRTYDSKTRQDDTRQERQTRQNEEAQARETIRAGLKPGRSRVVGDRIGGQGLFTCKLQGYGSFRGEDLQGRGCYSSSSVGCSMLRQGERANEPGKDHRQPPLEECRREKDATVWPSPLWLVWLGIVRYGSKYG